MNWNTQVILWGTNDAEKGVVASPVFTAITDGVDTAQVSAVAGGALQVDIVAPLPTGTNTIGKVDQGLQGTLAQSWFTQITDGVDGPVNVTPGFPGGPALDVNIVNSSIIAVVSAAPFDDPFPVGGFASGFSYGAPPFGAVDPGDMGPARIYDGDTGAAGAETVLGVNLRKAAAGGSVAFGTVADPVVVQQGTAAALAGGWPVKITDGVSAVTTTTVGADVALDINIVGPLTGLGNVRVAVIEALPTGGNTIGRVDQGLQGTLAQSWFTQITDGVDGPVDVRNTAPTGAEFGLVGHQGLPNVIANAWPTKITDGVDTAQVSAAAGGALQVDIVSSIVISVIGTVTANQGTPNTVANAWPILVTDGTDTAQVSIVSGLGALRVDVVDAPHTYGAAFPVRGFAVGFFDGVNMQSGRVYDLDGTGATEYVVGVVLRQTNPAGGSFEIGTAANPVRVDPTGTTTQPVSGTVTANQGTPNTLANRWPVLIGGLTPAGGGPNAVTVTDFGVGLSKALDVNIINSITVGSLFGAAFPATGLAAGFKNPVTGFMEGGTVTVGPSGTIPAGRQAVDVNVLSFTGTITGADETRPVTGVQLGPVGGFPVIAPAFNVTGPNPARRGMTVNNTSTARTVFLLFELASTLTVSPTKFSVRIAPGGFYELPFPAFDGSIDAIWSAGAPGGSLQVTELTFP